jgi:hypothetical protein
MRRDPQSLCTGALHQFPLGPVLILAIRANGVDHDWNRVAGATKLLRQLHARQPIIPPPHVRDEHRVIVHRQEPERILGSGRLVNGDPAIRRSSKNRFSNALFGG